MSININITFIHILRFILVSKSTPFAFFHMNIHLHHHIFRRRFVYIHTFFHNKIMCGCRLITCLYDIQQTSYERRLHHSYVAPSVPIWAKFTFTIGTICSWSIRTVTSHLSLPVVLRRATIIYMHIFAGENGDAVIRTRAHEKIQVDFFRAEPLYVLYIAGKNVKNCKVRSCLCPLDPSIFHFIWVNHGGKIWQLEPSNLICEKMEISWKVGNCADCIVQAHVSCAKWRVASETHSGPIAARIAIILYEYQRKKKSP